jgi:hypothetical protein
MRLALATLWILIGCAINGGIYWVFLNTPESTVWTLGASALLAIVIAIVDALTVTGAVTISANGLSRSGVARAVRAIPSIIPASLIFVLLWWVTVRGETWIGMRGGQISAWFIAQFGWADISWLLTAIRYMAIWIRWVLATMLALSLIAGVVAVGPRAMVQSAWLRRALRPRALLLASLWFVVLIAWPWNYVVPWRPAAVPPTSIEVVFIAVKLSLCAIMFAIAVALMIREASGAAAPPRDPEAAVQAA